MSTETAKTAMVNSDKASDTTTPVKTSTEPQTTEWERFVALARHVVSAPKAQVDAAIEAERAKRVVIDKDRVK